MPWLAPLSLDHSSASASGVIERWLIEATVNWPDTAIYDWSAGIHDGNAGFLRLHMDVLSNVLRVANLTGGVFLHVDYTLLACSGRNWASETVRVYTGCLATLS
jgi:hypothetical protein